MKKLLFAFILLVSASSCGTPSLRVGSFNIWRSDLGKNEYEWSVRKYRLVNAIKDVDFDIFGAQEVDTTMIRELPILFKGAGLDYNIFIFRNDAFKVHLIVIVHIQPSFILISIYKKIIL